MSPDQGGSPPVTTDAEPPQGSRPRGLTRHSVLSFLARYGAILVLLGMCVAFSFLSPYFLTKGNLLIVLNQVAIVAVMAGGLTIVLAAGQFDLSVGYVASFAGIVSTGTMVLHGQPVWVGVLAGLAIGAAVGLCNGFIVSKLKVNALVATLGVGTMVIGLNYLYHSGTSITSGIPDAFVAIALSTPFLGISNLVLISAGILVLLWIFLNLTVRGQETQALGGSEEAALLAGVRVDRVRITAFVIVGLCAGAAGVLLAASLSGGTSTAADGYLLDAYAAAFLGSVVLRNGQFHIFGTVIGVITVGVGFNGLALFGAPSSMQYLFKGGLLVAAMALSTGARRYGLGAKRSGPVVVAADSDVESAAPAGTRAGDPTG
ncbi:MAG: ABC transporter permease [Actinomycetota bacterium]|nr:ABC transporter permease [Actinomycetota bacterium]